MEAVKSLSFTNEILKGGADNILASLNQALTQMDMDLFDEVLENKETHLGNFSFEVSTGEITFRKVELL